MLGNDLDATSTAFRVGYNDASHFNREYKRLFGLPPMRDMERLREVAGQHGGRPIKSQRFVNLAGRYYRCAKQEPGLYTENWLLKSLFPLVQTWSSVRFLF
jgi:AraC-like DNA-binding protein